MGQNDLDSWIKGSLLGADYGVFLWPLIAIALAVVVLFIRLYLKEWREKRGYTFWERERQHRMAKKQGLTASPRSAVELRERSRCLPSRKPALETALDGKALPTREPPKNRLGLKGGQCNGRGSRFGGGG
jgi:hypothetical protein